MSSVEEKLLLKSHSPERAKELLETRYSLRGDQKPYLVLTPTKGWKDVKSGSASRASTPASATDSATATSRVVKKNRKGVRTNARTALNDYIKKALKQRDAIRQKVRWSSDPGSISQTNPASHADGKDLLCTYEMFEPLHRLWRDYIGGLVYDNAGNTTIDLSDPAHARVAAGKLATADYNGAYISVVSARNPSLVGVEGIVIWDARASFVVVCRNSHAAVRVVQKKGVIFRVPVYRSSSDNDPRFFEIIGSRFQYRAVDRAGRKFKSHAVEDI